MVQLSIVASTSTSTSTSSSYYSTASPSTPNDVLPSPASMSISSHRSAASSRLSFNLGDDDEDATVTFKVKPSSGTGAGPLDDIHLLAISTHMTELSYAISDIQTRIFEIQELRHKSQAQSQSPSSTSNESATNTTSVIDQSLMTLDEKLEMLDKGIRTISESLEPLLTGRASATPTLSLTAGAAGTEKGYYGSPNEEESAILRKHAALVADWESVQAESDVLREELKEDKWLTVFRTVTDQADGMMSSLEKAVNRCQEFIWLLQRRGHDDFQSNAATQSRSERMSVNFEMFTSLLDSYEAKKKHYMPATSKVLAIIDKGVHDRVTKNGETLRRHAESAQRWKNLRDRITRTDAEMENARRILLGFDTDQESTTSATSTKNGHLAATPVSSKTSRMGSAGTIALSRSISPFRKFARKLTSRTSSSSSTTSATPLQTSKKSVQPSSEPPLPASNLRRQRVSLFAPGRVGEPSTPVRPGHKHSQSYTPESSPSASRIERVDLGNNPVTSSTASRSTGPPVPPKQKWNSSTKIDAEERAATIKATTPKRPPSSTGSYATREDLPPIPTGGTPYRRSLSRTSMASSRPWSPVTSSNSTTYSSSPFYPPVPTLRTPSRSQTPSRAVTPSIPATPRTRPKTPSHIPAPSKAFLRSVSGPAHSLAPPDDDRSFLLRSPSPSMSTSYLDQPPPRPPSRSMIPIPSVHLNSVSRPGSSMSDYRSESPTFRFRSAASRAQTPEAMLKTRVQQVPVFHGSSGSTVGRGSASRPTIVGKLPPSSFRDGVSRTPSSRPSSRSGSYTPSMDQLPLHEYFPGNTLDPLDVEVSNVCNSLAHGLMVERVDPPLKKSQTPKEGEEVKAQYAFSNALARKVVTCRLTTLTRRGESAAPTKKVMVRVGGGWQDLSHYILNRQAGL